MRRFYMTLLLWMTVSHVMGQSSSDSVLICRLLEKESATWRAQDSAGHASCWAIRPYSKIWISLGDGRVLDVDPKLMITASPAQMGHGGSSQNSNYAMHIDPHQAWVTHHEISVSKEGRKTISWELRLLEKTDDGWKLVGQSIHLLPE